MTEGWRENGKTYIEKACPKCPCKKQLLLSQQIDPWSNCIRYETLRLCCNDCKHHWDHKQLLPSYNGKVARSRTDEKEKPGKAWIIGRVEARRDARAAGKVFTGYGICPLCREVDPFNTTRERNPYGYTRCGACDGRTKSKEWKQPDDTA